MPSLHYPILALVAGIGIPIMASISGALGQRLLSTSAAATVLFLGAFIVSFCVLLINGFPVAKQIYSAPPHLYIGGLFVAFYVLTITYLVPRFGVGNAIFFVLLGQMISAMLIDYFGFLGAPAVPISWVRVAGVALMVVGVFLARKVS